MNEPRLATIKEMEEILKAESLYKVAHVNHYRGYSSCFRGQPCDRLQNTSLKYSIGMVTEDFDTGRGIYCYANYDEANKHAQGLAGMSIQEPCVVLEVKPLCDCSHCTNQPKPKAVYVVGIAHKDAEVQKEEEYVSLFKVGDKVRVKASVESPKQGWAGLLRDDVGVVEKINGARMEVRFPSFCNGKDTWVAHAPEMELAPPEPKWEDVTKECELTFASGSYIDIWHSGHLVANAGHKTTKSLVCPSGYMIETEDTGTWGTFKVLKLVS